MRSAAAKTQALSSRRVYVEISGKTYTMPCDQFYLLTHGCAGKCDLQEVGSVPMGRKINYVEGLPFGLTDRDFQWK